MTNTFVPHKKPKKINVTISKREAVLLQKLRKYPFGRFTVHKADNIITRLEINDSQLIDEDVTVNLD